MFKRWKTVAVRDLRAGDVVILHGKYRRPIRSIRPMNAPDDTVMMSGFDGLKVALEIVFASGESTLAYPASSVAVAPPEVGPVRGPSDAPPLASHAGDTPSNGVGGEFIELVAVDPPGVRESAAAPHARGRPWGDAVSRPRSRQP